MDNTYLSLLIFTVITIIYFVLIKAKLTAELISNDPENVMSTYTKTNLLRLAIYFMLIILTQFALNASTIISTCGGSITQNIGVAFVMTFIPWVFIFGLLIAVIVMFPGIKSAFSDVIGYFVVSGSANTLLSELLIDTNLSATMENSSMTGEQKTAMEAASEVVMKLKGDTGILINQITPENFIGYWNTLQPLMNPIYKNNLEKQDQLLQLVTLRDNIGEACWYIYTAILLISIVQYNLAARGCVKDLATMEKDYQDFLTKEDQIDADQKKATATTYTINN